MHLVYLNLFDPYTEQLKYSMKVNLEHLKDGIIKGGSSAVLAASIFHFGEYSIQEAKEYLKKENVPVRL